MKVTYLSYKIENKAYLTTINRRSGSINHFYHFLIDFIWPLFHSMQVYRVTGQRMSWCITNDKEAMFFGEHFSEVFGTNIRRNKFHILKSRLLHAGSPLTLVGFNSKRRDYYQVFKTEADFRESHRRLRAYILSALGIRDTHQLPLVVLIERKASVAGGGAERRTIVNHHELQDSLQTHCKAKGLDFQNVELSSISFKEQVALFSRENVTIIGQHGAGLIHMLWLPQNGRLIELMGPTNEHFKNLANDLGICYHRIYCKQDDPTVSQRELIYVNVNEVLNMI